MKDYYEILGISKNATKDDIKKAYRKLAHRYHPDKGGGDEKKFKEASEAYQVLYDEKKRSEYDTYGRTFDGGAGASGAGGFGGGQGFDFSGFGGGQGFDADLGDIFESFFGGAAGAGRRQKNKRGADIAVDLDISFEEAVFGAERKIILTKVSQCQTCKGSGAEPGSEVETCPVCQGSGRVHESRRTIFGTVSAFKECARCLGRGNVYAKKCPTCKGQGVYKRSEEVIIRVPPGIKDGEAISMPAAGEAVAGGTPGDLYIRINARRHPVFRRDGDNLAMDLDLKMSEAMLGAEKDIMTLDGEIKLKIPAGIDSGEVLRVRGKGVPIGRNFASSKNRGDLLIRAVVRMPKKVSKKSRELIEELKKEGL